MPEQLTPTELLLAAEASIVARYPNTHLRQEALDRIEEAKGWVTQAEAIRSQPKVDFGG